MQATQLHELIAQGEGAHVEFKSSFQKYGSGVRRVIDTCIAYGLPEPEFEATQGGMAVTVFKTASTDAGGKTSPTPSLTEGVNEGVKALLALIQENPGLRAPALASLMTTSPKNVERWVKQLRKDQRITFVGAPKTGGYHCL